jgi:hypothetical protein
LSLLNKNRLIARIENYLHTTPAQAGGWQARHAPHAKAIHAPPIGDADARLHGPGEIERGAKIWKQLSLRFPILLPIQYAPSKDNSIINFLLIFKI